ncbi:MAG: hypothetical protein ACFCGT_02225 [Sandaracinaceae bacterium]
MSLLRLLTDIHGHLGVLAAVALIHPALLLRRGRPLTRGMRWAVTLSTGLVTLAFGLGIGLYEPYRAEVRRPLFFASRTAGLLFETKEHLAFMALCLALGGAACALGAPRGDPGLRRLAAALFLGAALLAGAVVALGTYVASVRTFAG